METLREQTILVTGAAGGIARAIIDQLAVRGARLALIDVNEQALTRLVMSLRERGVQVSYAIADLSTEWGVRRSISTALEPFEGRTDVLLATVGKLVRGRFTEMSSDKWEASLAINFMSHVWAVQAVLPAMTSQGQGRILFIGSDQGTQPDSGLSAYAAAKAALHNLAKVLARELAPHILVNALAPGMTRTALVEKELMEGYAQEFGTNAHEAERRELARRGVPLARLGEPEEVAEAALFLLGNDFATGTILDLSGGNVRGV